MGTGGFFAAGPQRARSGPAIIYIRGDSVARASACIREKARKRAGEKAPNSLRSVFQLERRSVNLENFNKF